MLVPQIVEAGLFVETRDDDATVELLVGGQRAVDIDLSRCVIELPIFQRCGAAELLFRLLGDQHQGPGDEALAIEAGR